MEDVKAAPEGAVLLLHSCAHNPTGVDPSLDQWKGILKLVQEKKLLPFFDSAYQARPAIEPSPLPRTVPVPFHKTYWVTVPNP